VVMLVYPYNN